MLGIVFPFIKIFPGSALVWSVGSVANTGKIRSTLVKVPLKRILNWQTWAFVAPTQKIRRDRVCTIQIPTADRIGREGQIRGYRIGQARIALGIHANGKASLSRGNVVATFRAGSLSGCSWALSELNKLTPLNEGFPVLPYEPGEYHEWPLYYRALIREICDELLWLKWQVCQARARAEVSR